MKTKLLPLFSVCLVSCLTGAEQGTGDSENQTEKQKYDLTLTIRGNKWDADSRSISPDNPVIFNICNRNQTPVYILDLFEVNGKPFFLSMTIHDAEGKVVLEFDGRRKVELCSPLKYVRLSQNESYNVTFPFNKVIKEKYPDGLPQGEYTATATYENDKGENCFKGKLVSQPVKFTVKE